jgi:hypothetical protein
MDQRIYVSFTLLLYFLSEILLKQSSTQVMHFTIILFFTFCSTDKDKKLRALLRIQFLINRYKANVTSWLSPLNLGTQTSNKQKLSQLSNQKYSPGRSVQAQFLTIR